MKFLTLILLAVLAFVGRTTSTDDFFQITQIGENFVITPKYNVPQRTLIWIHGLGNNSAGFIPFYTQYYRTHRPDFRVVMLTAPNRTVEVLQNRTTYSWYNIKRFDFTLETYDQSINLTQAEESAQIIIPWIDQAVAYHQGDSTKVFIGGFSQGCSMSLHTGLQYPKTLGGILAFSGFLFPKTRENKAQESIPLLISHGKADPVVPFDMGVSSYVRIRTDKHKFQENYMEGVAHVFDYDMIGVMIAFFNTFAAY